MTDLATANPKPRFLALFVDGLARYAVMLHGPERRAGQDGNPVLILVRFPLALGTATPWLMDTARTTGFWPVSARAILLIVALASACVCMGRKTPIRVFIGLPQTLPLLLIGVALGREFTRPRDRMRPPKNAAATALAARRAAQPNQFPTLPQDMPVTDQTTIAAPAAVTRSRIDDISERTPIEHSPAITRTLPHLPRPARRNLAGQTRLTVREMIAHMAAPHALARTRSLPQGDTMPGNAGHFSPSSNRLRLAHGRHRPSITASGTQQDVGTGRTLSLPLNPHITARAIRMQGRNPPAHPPDLRTPCQGQIMTARSGPDTRPMRGARGGWASTARPPANPPAWERAAPASLLATPRQSLQHGAFSPHPFQDARP